MILKEVVVRSGGSSLCGDTYVVFDIETTGLQSAKKNKIIEIGAVKVENGEIIDQVFSTFVNPQVNRSPLRSRRLTGINDGDGYGRAAGVEEVLPRFLDVLRCEQSMVAHNAYFDMSFIELQRRATRDRF